MTHADRTVVYDAHIVSIEPQARVLVFRTDDRTHAVPVTHVDWWQVGQVGCLFLSPDPTQWAFHVYPDQRLRRARDLDDSEAGVWGWRVGEQHIVLKEGITPGKNGAFVKEDTETVDIAVPREFITLCAGCGLTPVAVLQGFIADLCALQNYCARPREDGYCSNGSDERLYAQQYFDRAYGAFPGVVGTSAR